MNATRFGALLGFGLGVVWAFAGLASALLTAVLTGLGFVVALVIEGRLDLAGYLGHRHDR